MLNGERIVWKGHPMSGVVLRPIDTLLVPFSLFWGGFALIWNIDVWATNAPVPFKLFGLPFLAVGLYLTVGRFWFDASAMKRVHYFVTDRRVLIAKRGGSSIESLDLKRLPTLKLNERSDGSGTIKFGNSGGMFGGTNGFGMWQASLDPEPQFFRIPNVRRVYEIIQAWASD